MSEKENKKVIKLSKIRQNKQDGGHSDIQNFEGFDYIKTDTDLNGTPFIKESLIEYASNCKYMVRVMKEEKSKTVLYNYYVPQEELCFFLSKIENGDFDGQLIEVEKYIPEDLA